MMKEKKNPKSYLKGFTEPSLSSVVVDNEDHFLRLALLALWDGDVRAGGVVLLLGVL